MRVKKSGGQKQKVCATPPGDEEDRFQFERALFEQGVRIVAGIDEVGRGPLAGPVVAAAVILPTNFSHGTLNDSKKLSPATREDIYTELTGREDVTWSIGIIDHDQIDRFNIAVATYMAMKLAVDGLGRKPDFLLIDGLPVPLFSKLRQLAVVKGDSKSFSIAAASVIAKVTRDRLMDAFDRQYPEYNFKQHKGYGTPEHLDALSKHGPSPIHRTSFFPIRSEPHQKQLEFSRQ